MYVCVPRCRGGRAVVGVQEREEETKADYEAQLARSQKLSEETLNAMRARNDEQTSLMEERHTAQVEALEREKEQIKEQHAAGWAHLPLPALLRSAIDDANAKLAEQHAAELSEVAKERRAEIDAVRAEAEEERREAQTAIEEQREFIERKAELQLSDARLEYETKLVEQTVTLEEFAELADFSFSLWDRFSGNETCPIGDDLASESCHGLKTHMGAVNSNHFLPQAYDAYRHYHELAMQHAKTCQEASEAMSPENRVFHRESLRACERMALTYEAFGQHFLQDAWSMGHMWERWGSPNREVMTDNFDAIAIGSVAGLIHGSTAVLQDEIGSFGDFSDSLCAPVHEETQYKTGHTHEMAKGLGDLFLSEALDSVTLQDVDGDWQNDGDKIMVKKGECLKGSYVKGWPNTGKGLHIEPEIRKHMETYTSSSYLFSFFTTERAPRARTRQYPPRMNKAILHGLGCKQGELGHTKATTWLIDDLGRSPLCFGENGNFGVFSTINSYAPVRLIKAVRTLPICECIAVK